MEKLNIESLKKCVFTYNVVGNLREGFWSATSVVGNFVREVKERTLT